MREVWPSRTRSVLISGDNTMVLPLHTQLLLGRCHGTDVAGVMFVRISTIFFATRRSGES